MQNRNLTGETDHILKLVYARFHVILNLLACGKNEVANGHTIAFSKGFPGYFARLWRW